MGSVGGFGSPVNGQLHLLFRGLGDGGYRAGHSKRTGFNHIVVNNKLTNYKHSICIANSSTGKFVNQNKKATI